MKILLTGSSGRIGRAVAAALMPWHQLVCVDRVAGEATQIVADIGDTEVMARCLAGVDAVVHCAGLHAPHVDVLPDSEFERINVQATLMLAEQARTAGVSRFVYTSTTALYGGASRCADRAAWITEGTVPQPLTIYHHSKLAAEQALAAWVGHGMGITILRMSRCFPEPAPMMAIYRLHRGVDARDAARAHALAVEQSGSGFYRYIISGVTPFLPEDIDALKNAAHDVLQARCPALVRCFAQREWPLPDTIDRVYDSALAQRELGWRPIYGWQKVIAQLDRGEAQVLASW